MDEHTSLPDLTFTPDAGQPLRAVHTQSASSAYGRLLKVSAGGVLAATLAACGAGEQVDVTPTGPEVSSSAVANPSVTTETTPTANPTARPTTAETPKPSPSQVPELLTKKLGFITITDAELQSEKGDYHAEQEALVDGGIKAFEQGTHGTIDLKKTDYGKKLFSIDPTQRAIIKNYELETGTRTAARQEVVEAALKNLNKKYHPDAWVVSLQVSDEDVGAEESATDRAATWETEGTTYTAIFEHPVTSESQPDTSVAAHELGHLINKTAGGEWNKYEVDEASGLKCTDILLRPSNGYPFKLTNKSLNSCISVPREDFSTGMGNGTMVDNVDFYGGVNEVQVGTIGDHVKFLDTSTPHTETIKLHTLADQKTDGVKVIGMLLPKDIDITFFDQSDSGRACLFLEESSMQKTVTLSNGQIKQVPDKNRSSVKAKIVRCDVSKDAAGKLQLKPYGQTFLLRTAGTDPGLPPSLRGDAFSIGNVTIAQTDSEHGTNNSWSELDITVG